MFLFPLCVTIKKGETLLKTKFEKISLTMFLRSYQNINIIRLRSSELCEHTKNIFYQIRKNVKSKEELGGE